MRELPPQPAKPVMPAYATTTPEPAAQETGPGADDSVIARDDHLEGTFTSRGTVVVMGSVKGRIEAVQVRIEDGAKVDADVIVDEAIVAGEFTGNLTCRERLEARASGRISGRVETYKLMLHEGASVEGEMHMLTESAKDGPETIRGSAPLRGDTKAEAKPAARSTTPTPSTAKPAPTVTPSSSAKSVAPAASAASTTATSSSPGAADSASGADASAVRSSVVETLRAETLRVAPRATTTSRGYGAPTSSADGASTGDRSGPSTTGF
jgi:cytoskeletal protein CcmA (bactofilin family)